jgi:hypothetical protein
MSKEKKTAVEWLKSQLGKSKDFQRVINEVNQNSTIVIDILEKAKEMEKQQIIDAVNEGIKQGYRDYIDTEWGRDNDYNPEQYYKKTYEAKEM